MSFGRVIIIPVTIRLHNYSRWDNENIRRVVHWVAKDLKLKRDIKFIFQTTWTEIDEAGEIGGLLLAEGRLAPKNA